MIANPSQLFELQRVQVGALNAIGRALISAAEKVSNLNVSAGRMAIDSATEAAQSLSGIKEPGDLLALTGASAQPSAEKVVSYARELVGIANGVSAEIGKVVEQQILESNRRMAELLDLVAKSAPAGSEQAVALMRSAVSASNTAFDTVSKVSRQTADWAQANFAAAAKAATAAAAVAGSAATAKAA
ncbi:MAG TPA: phasin family protein [Burkholderiaceae bacterium]|nr:phasin family protein [Burkholderiaceae bacterium]